MACICLAKYQKNTQIMLEEPSKLILIILSPFKAYHGEVIRNIQ